MAQFKNIHLLEGEIKPSDLTKMEMAAVQHRRHSNIQFKVVESTPAKVTIQVVQEKSSAGHYHNQKRLIEIVHETFDKFFPDKKILVHAIPYSESPANNVDSKWINDHMLSTGTRIKDLASDTGIDKTQMTALVTGNRPLSQPMRALFWFYFAFKEKEARPVKQKNS